MQLKPYQIEHVKHVKDIITRLGVILDTSSMGTGKTYTTCQVLAELRKPFFIICPGTIISKWISALREFGILHLAFGISNYESIIRLRYINPVDRKRGYFPGIIKMGSSYHWTMPKGTIIVFDEAHRCRNIGTMNSELLIGATNDKYPRILLTATSGESALQMYGTGYALGLWTTRNGFYENFCAAYGCQIVKVDKTHSAWKFTGGDFYIKLLHERIQPFICRMDGEALRKKGLFPLTSIHPEMFDMGSNEIKIRTMFIDIFDIAMELKDKEGKYRSAGLKAAVYQKRLQQIELYKIPTLIELARDYNTAGHSVVIFVNYVETVDMLQPALKCPTLYGKNSKKENKENIDLFMANSANILICTIKSGGEAVEFHDQFHRRPRVALISPSYSAKDMIQALGRIDRMTGTNTIQYILFAANTPEEIVYRKMKEKIDNIQTLNDDDLSPLKEYLQLRGNHFAKR